MSRSSSDRPARAGRTAAAVAGLLIAALLSGCGITVPSDPDGTLNAVTGGELRVGTSPDRDLVELSGDEPRGPVVDLVDGFAAHLDAETTWTVASEETLVRMLEQGDLDLIAGALTPDTPWIDKAGVTRGYPGIDGAGDRELVMLVPLGENAFLSSLESYLDRKVGSP